MKKKILTTGMQSAIELMNCGYKLNRDPFTLKVELIKVRLRLKVIPTDFAKLWVGGYIVQDKPNSNLSMRTFSLTENYVTNEELFTCPECGDFAYRCIEYNQWPGGGGSFTNGCTVCEYSTSDSF